MKRKSDSQILMLAPSCDGTDVGEAWSTFQWVHRLSKRYRLTVLTFNKRNRPAAAPQLPGVEVVEWRDWPLLGRFDRLNSHARPAYLSFYWKARNWLKQNLSQRQFQFVHQLSPLALRYPCPAAGLGIPLVIGPLGGSLPTPAGFRNEIRGSAWYTRLRALDSWRLRHDGLLRRTYEAAELVIGVAPYVRALMADLNIRRFEVINETGVKAIPKKSEFATDFSSGVTRLLFVGRVIRSKGTRDAIRALGHLKDCPSVMLDVVGDGEDMPACRREAGELGLNGRVNFHGWLAREQIDEFYNRADILMFPSLREPSGNVVLEGMSHGLALIVADNGGPAFTVDDTCGIRVTPSTPEQYAVDLASAVRRLVRDPALLRQMKIAARDRVKNMFLWDRNIQQMSALYESVLEGRREYVPVQKISMEPVCA